MRILPILGTPRRLKVWADNKSTAPIPLVAEDGAAIVTEDEQKVTVRSN